jgi:poly(hydroxyalkanoate) depolymerase family esterase
VESARSVLGVTLMVRPALFPVLALVVVTGCSSSSPGGSATSLCPPKTAPADLPGLPGAGSTGTGTSGAGTGGAITEVTSFGDNPGGLKMFVHAPAGGKASAVVVAMHGCTQGASDYVNAGWSTLADRAGFAVVYPEQTTANSFQKCFRWYEKGQIERGAGEAASIAAMTAYAKSQYGATHAYVTGLSAGAAMTAVMLATYPDIFEAGAIMAGLPYACATSQTDAYSCMSPGRDKTPEAWAALVPTVAGASPPRVSIWHGDADYVVRPMNETELVKQWTGVAGMATAAPVMVAEAATGVTHAEYKDSTGVVRVESWLVKGMSHGVALAPKAGCGTAGAYLLDEGVCSTEKAAAFFGLLAADGTPTPGGSSGSSGSSSSSSGDPSTDCK